jgi:mannan polymerase II complex MNN11 subunit
MINRWHGTILSKLALVPQRIMNSYDEKIAKLAQEKGVYQKGDFILNFGDCEKNCATLMRPYFSGESEPEASS